MKMKKKKKKTTSLTKTPQLVCRLYIYEGVQGRVRMEAGYIYIYILFISSKFIARNYFFPIPTCPSFSKLSYITEHALGFSSLKI
jgi:hypothetical protein